MTDMTPQEQPAVIATQWGVGTAQDPAGRPIVLVQITAMLSQEQAVALADQIRNNSKPSLLLPPPGARVGL